MRSRRQKLIFLIIVVVMVLQPFVNPAVAANADGFYTTLAERSYRIKNSFELVNTGANEALSVTATVLVGAISSSPYQQSINYKVTPLPKYIYTDSSGNIYAEVMIDKIKAGETKTITVEKELINSGISYSKDIYKLQPDYTSFKSNSNNLKYLQAGSKVEVNATEIQAKAGEFDASKPVVQLAKDIYDYVNVYIDYDERSTYANKGALSAIRTAKGVCDEYASLFTALSRAKGVPARIVTGYWLDEPLKQNAWNDISSNIHAWVEFYVPETGWIPAEPTFIYTLNRIRTPNSNYFANIAPDDIHLLYSYQRNDLKSDVSIIYSYYKTTAIDIRFGEQSVMPISSTGSFDAFSDIGSSWAKEYINKLYNRGILFSKQSGQYKPADNITRAEFAAYLVNTLGLEPKTTTVSFKDIKDSSDYAAFIRTAAAYGLITGDPQGYYKPNDPITRQDAATIMKRAIDVTGASYGVLSEPVFNDGAQVSSYAKDAVKLIYNLQIMTGKPGNLFEPKSYTTKAEVSKILDNFIEAAEY